MLYSLDGVSPTVAVDGAVLRYVVRGTGPPALVIGSAIYYPRTFSRRLGEALRLIFVDARHFAAQDVSQAPAGISLDRYMADIEALRSHLGLERAIVIGHSHHGNLAFEYAKRFPERVSRLVLIGSPPADVDTTVRAAEAYWQAHASGRRRATLRRRLAALQAAGLEQMTPQQAYVAQYVAEAPKYWHDPAYDAAPLWQGVPIGMDAIRQFRGFFSAGYAMRWNGLPSEVPALVVMGRHDYAVPHTLWNDVLPTLEGKLSYHLFQRCGHTPQLEESERFDRLLLDWLANTGRGAG